MIVSVIVCVGGAGGIGSPTTKEHLLPGLILKNFPLLILIVASILLSTGERYTTEEPFIPKVPGLSLVENSTSYTFPLSHFPIIFVLTSVLNGLSILIPSSVIL